MEEESKGNAVFRKKKLVLSGNHLKRLNSIHSKFGQSDLIPPSSNLDRSWFNTPRYEAPINHHYPKNPFSNDKSNSFKNTEPGTFHVGIKFLGKPEEMLKLVCLTLIKIEIEW